MYLAICTRPDLFFAFHLLARHSATPTARHSNEGKYVFCYLRNHTNTWLFFPFDANHKLVSHAHS